MDGGKADAARTGDPEELPPAIDEEEALTEQAALRRRLALPRDRSLRAHTARGVIINSLFQIGLSGVGLVRRIGIAAFLTQTEYGLWGLIVSTLVTLSWLKQVGIADKYVQQDDPDEEVAFQKAFTLELLYSLLTYVFVLAALPGYALLYGHDEMILPGAIAGLALVVNSLQSPIWIAYRRMQFVRQRTLESVDPLVTVAVTFALAAAGYGYWSLVVGGLAGAVAGSISAVATSTYRLAFRYDRGTLREYFGFSWPLLVSSVSGLVVVQGAVIVTNFSVGIAGVGVFGLAATINLFVDRVDAIIRQTIYPAVCAVRDRRDVFFEAFVKSNRVGVIFGLTFGVGFGLFAPDLVSLLGERWDDATGLLQAVGLIVGVRQIAYNWTVFIRADGDTRPLAVNSAAIVAAFLVITAPLILVLGLTGYAIGLAATVVVDLAIRTHYLKRLFPGFGMVSYLYRSIIPCVPGAAAVLVIRLIADGERTTTLVSLELAAFFSLVAAATFILERPLLTEVIGYLRGRDRRLATA